MMARLTHEDIHGVWSAVPLSWDERDRIDEKSYITNIERQCSAGVHGIYTSGTTGEFYALDDDEFRRMVDMQCEVCQDRRMPLQIGCCADATRKTLRMLEYSASQPAVGAAQVTLPYWMELSDREVLAFFREISRACPDLPLVHYNIPRAKRYLTADDYLRIQDVAPTLIGVKFTFAGSHFGELQQCLRRTSNLSFLVAEALLVSAMMLGARGTCSSIALMNPSFILRMYSLAKSGDWPAALAMQTEVAAFNSAVVDFISLRGEGTCDPVIDKGLGVAAGGLVGSVRTRSPYQGWSEETVAATSDWLRRTFVQFLAPGRT